MWRRFLTLTFLQFSEFFDVENLNLYFAQYALVYPHVIILGISWRHISLKFRENHKNGQKVSKFDDLGQEMKCF